MEAEELVHQRRARAWEASHKDQALAGHAVLVPVLCLLKYRLVLRGASRFVREAASPSVGPAMGEWGGRDASVPLGPCGFGAQPGA